MLAEGLRAQQAEARALVLVAVVASAMTRMIAMVGSFSRVAAGASAGIEGAACIAVVAETLMHRDSSALSATRWCLVDRRVPGRARRDMSSPPAVPLHTRVACESHGEEGFHHR